MKIKLLLALAVLSSCTKARDYSTIEEFHHIFSVNAVISNLQEEESTKAIGQNVMRLMWNKGDKISVVNVSTGKALGGSLTADSYGTSSIFSGELTGTINANDKLAFIYPSQNYTSETSFEPIEIDYSVQDTTTPPLVMIAHHTMSTGTNSFENINVDFNFQMSFVRVNLSQLPVSTAINSVQMNGVNDHIRLSISNGSMISSTSTVKNYIKYTKSFTTDARGAGSILMGILPSSATSSRSITAETLINRYDAYFTNAELKVNRYYYTNVTGFIQSIMTFKDASVKAKCIDYFDKNGDGQLSFLEAAAVTDLGVSTKAAGDNPFPTSILHFAELQFFTGLASIPVFTGYNMLKTVAIPEQIKSLADYTFKNCTALENVIFKSSDPPILGTDVFKNCDPYLKIYVPTQAVGSYKSASGWSGLSDRIHDVAEVGADFGLEGWGDGGNIGGSAE